MPPLEPRPTPPLSPFLFLSLRHPNPINPVPLTFKLQPLTGRHSPLVAFPILSTPSQLPPDQRRSFHRVAASEAPRETLRVLTEDVRGTPEEGDGGKRVKNECAQHG